MVTAEKKLRGVARNVDYDPFVVAPLHRILTNYCPQLPVNDLIITNVDVLSETIRISNRSSVSRDLTGCTLRDQEDKHVFRFPDNFSLSAHSEVVVYCTPGKLEGSDSLSEPYLLWTNADGSLRRKEVLNNGECCVIYVVTFRLR